MKRRRTGCYYGWYTEQMDNVRHKLAASYLRATVRRKKTVQWSVFSGLLWANWVCSLPSVVSSRSVLPHLCAIAVASCIVKTAKSSLKKDFERQQEAKSLYHRIAQCQSQDEFCRTMSDVYKHLVREC